MLPLGLTQTCVMKTYMNEHKQEFWQTFVGSYEDVCTISAWCHIDLCKTRGSYLISVNNNTENMLLILVMF